MKTNSRRYCLNLVYTNKVVNIVSMIQPILTRHLFHKTIRLRTIGEITTAQDFNKGKAKCSTRHQVSLLKVFTCPHYRSQLLRLSICSHRSINNYSNHFSKISQILSSKNLLRDMMAIELLNSYRKFISF